jgi:hypothetical protein
MTVTPQSYPLWLAQVVDGEVQVGFIVAWAVTEQVASARDADQVAQPIVAFTDDNCYAWGTMPASRTAPRFICDNREAAMESAERWLLQGRLGRRGRTPIEAASPPQLDGGAPVAPSIMEEVNQPSSSST